MMGVLLILVMIGEGVREVEEGRMVSFMVFWFQDQRVLQGIPSPSSSFGLHIPLSSFCQGVFFV